MTANSFILELFPYVAIWVVIGATVLGAVDTEDSTLLKIFNNSYQLTGILLLVFWPLIALVFIVYRVLSFLDEQ